MFGYSNSWILFGYSNSWILMVLRVQFQRGMMGFFLDLFAPRAAARSTCEKQGRAESLQAFRAAWVGCRGEARRRLISDRRLYPYLAWVNPKPPHALKDVGDDEDAFKSLIQEAIEVVNDAVDILAPIPKPPPTRKRVRM
jgi:hypothetical protein